MDISSNTPTVLYRCIHESGYHNNRTEIKLNITDLERMLQDNMSDFSSCDDLMDDYSPFYAPIKRKGPPGHYHDHHHHVNITPSSSASILQSCRHHHRLRRQRTSGPKNKRLSKNKEDQSDIVDAKMELQKLRTIATRWWKKTRKWLPRSIYESLPGISSFESAMPSQEDDHIENIKKESHRKIIPDVEKSSQGSVDSSSAQSDEDALIGRLAEENNIEMGGRSIWSEGHNEDHSFTVGINDGMSQSDDSLHKTTSASSESYLQQSEEDSQPPMDYGSYYYRHGAEKKGVPFVGNEEHDKVGSQPSSTFSSTLLTGESTSTLTSGSLTRPLTYGHTIVSSSSPAGSVQSFDTNTKVDEGSNSR